MPRFLGKYLVQGRESEELHSLGSSFLLLERPRLSSAVRWAMSGVCRQKLPVLEDQIAPFTSISGCQNPRKLVNSLVFVLRQILGRLGELAFSHCNKIPEIISVSSKKFYF